MLNSKPIFKLSALSLLGCLLHTGTVVASDKIFTDTTADTLDMSPGDGVCADITGKCSLRAAIQEANAGGMPISIFLEPGKFYRLQMYGPGEDFALLGDLDVHGDIKLFGRHATVDAMGQDRAFDVQPGANLEVAELSVMNGAVAAESGGAFRVSTGGKLALRRSRVENSSATGSGASGGAVFNDNGELWVRETTLKGNSAERAGGAIEANAGDTSVFDSTFELNTTGPAPGNGGALHLTGTGRVAVKTSIVKENTATAEGGGLWNSSTGEMVVDSTQLMGNVAEGAAADNGGGALFNDGGTMTVRLSSIWDNAATGASGSGGGLFNNRGTMALSLTNVLNNTAMRAGGAVEAVEGHTSLWDSRLTGNVVGNAPGNGGGLHLTGAGVVEVRRTTVSENIAGAEGGGLWNSGSGNMMVSRSDIFNNEAMGNDADQGGGGIFNDGGMLMVFNSAIDLNTATGASGSGGGIFNNGGEMDVRRTYISENVSQRAGGGIEARDGQSLLIRVSMYGNSTGASPGNGGGFHLTGTGNVTIDRGAVDENDAAAEGGGLWNSATGTMVVTKTSIQGNTAPIGAEVFNDGGTFTVDGAVVPVGP